MPAPSSTPSSSGTPSRGSNRTGHKSIYSAPYEEVVAGLRRARQAANLSQEDLADRLGRTQLWVSRTERGERRADLLEWLEFMLGCGADPHTFLDAVAGKVTLPRRHG